MKMQKFAYHLFPATSVVTIQTSISPLYQSTYF
nr:MAG TPA: hypothetical protein [Caudoviricetes sp.]